jgi:hypothetical protein
MGQKSLPIAGRLIARGNPGRCGMSRRDDGGSLYRLSVIAGRGVVIQVIAADAKLE